MDPPGEEVYAQEPLVVSLMKAIGDDNIGLLESLIRTQLACVNAGFPRTVSGDEPLIPGTRPVHFAAARLNVSAVRLLLQMGADPGLPDRGGYTAIHVAADSGHADILDLVLAGRPTGPMLAALTTPASDGQSPLSLAAGRGYSAAVSRLLGAGAKHSVSLMAPCALRSAIRFGHADVVRVLVKNIDAVGGIAKLPLFLTCASLPGRAVILDLLLSAEGKKKRRKWARSSCQGVPLLTYAAGYGILANVNVLLAAGADETIVDTLGRDMVSAADEDLLLAVQEGDRRRVKRILEAGVASVNGGPDQLVMPLVTAAGKRDISMVKLLLKKGADTEVASEEEIHFFGVAAKMKGTRALHLAAGFSGAAVVSLLLEAGANPNVRNSVGRSPLMYACELADKEQRVAVAQMLVEAGADVLQPANDGLVPLYYAAYRGYVPMIDFFLAKSPSALNRSGRAGETALCVAAQRGHEEAVRRLLSAGARSCIFVDNHSCALHCAALQAHEGIVRLLVGRLDAMGGVNVLPGALQIAVEKRFPRILRILLNAEGAGRQRHWAMFRASSFPPLLHLAAEHEALSCASVLLVASADETVTDYNGHRAVDLIGRRLPGSARNPKKQAAFRRMLARGSAFRARSWAWRVGGSGTATAGAIRVFASADDKATAPLGVRIFRPESANIFVRTMGRYARKL